MHMSIHKILIHGPQIIDQALLPVGQLIEEAQEAKKQRFQAISSGIISQNFSLTHK